MITTAQLAQLRAQVLQDVNNLFDSLVLADGSDIETDTNETILLDLIGHLLQNMRPHSAVGPTSYVKKTEGFDGDLCAIINAVTDLRQDLWVVSMTRTDSED